MSDTQNNTQVNAQPDNMSGNGNAAGNSGQTSNIFGEKRKVAQGMKARNPDVSVNYTRLDLI